MSAPKATHDYQPGQLDAAIEFLKRTRWELRSLRKVRIWKDKLCVYDVNGDFFEVRGIGYGDADILPLLRLAGPRLARFCAEALPSYEERRSNPADPDGSSKLSPYLHFGQIAAAEVARAALGSGERVQTEKFLDELVTWRELSLNFCSRKCKVRVARGAARVGSRKYEGARHRPAGGRLFTRGTRKR